MDILKFDVFTKFSEFNKLYESINQDDPDNLLRKEAKSDVKRCVSKLVSLHPFFGEYLITCRFLFDHPSIDTMATDGRNIFVNSAFVAKMSEAETIFVLCHEVLHMMLLHHSRMYNKIGENPSMNEVEQWNYAADYELNPMLIADGFLTVEELTEGIKGLYKEEFIGKPAEWIYDNLPSKDHQSINGDYPADIGNVVYTKNGKYGKIVKVNANNTYEIEEITEDEAKNLLN